MHVNKHTKNIVVNIDGKSVSKQQQQQNQVQQNRFIKLMTSPIVHIIFTLLVVIFAQTKASQQHNIHPLRLESVNNKNGAIVHKLLIPRPPGSPNHQQVQQHLRSWFRDMGWHEQVHAFTANTPKGPLPMANLIFTQNRTAPQRIVIAAHYDSKVSVFDDGGASREGQFVGATDSAVPCAMIVELCRAMTDILVSPAANKNNVTLQAVFFDGEEALVNWTATDSLYGSRMLAHLWLSNNGDAAEHNLQNMRLFVLLDLLGAARPRIPTYSDVTEGEFLQLVQIEDQLTKEGKIHNRPSTENVKYFHFSPRVGSGLFVLDDHVPFHQRGFKHILHLIPSPFPSVWHRMADNGDAMDGPTIDDLMLILFEFLRLQFK